MCGCYSNVANQDRDVQGKKRFLLTKHLFVFLSMIKTICELGMLIKIFFFFTVLDSKKQSFKIIITTIFEYVFLFLVWMTQADIYLE